MQYSSSDLSGWASGMIDCGGYSGISISSVNCWLENNLGLLNVKLGTEYSLESGVVTPEMGSTDMAVYTQMYDCFFLKRASRQTSTYALSELAWSRIEGDEQGFISRSTPSEVAKVFRGLATDCEACLGDLVYEYNRAGCLPRQVLTYPTYWDGLVGYLPPTFLTRNVIARDY